VVNIPILAKEAIAISKPTDLLTNDIKRKKVQKDKQHSVMPYDFFDLDDALSTNTEVR
jgi:hypothetical protein